MMASSSPHLSSSKERYEMSIHKPPGVVYFGDTRTGLTLANSIEEDALVQVMDAVFLDVVNCDETECQSFLNTIVEFLDTSDADNKWLKLDKSGRQFQEI